MQTKDGILLHIFSGYHIGAELCLAQGTYIFGSDETCDFILSDTGIAGKHFLLEILAKPLTLAEESKQEYEIAVSPLEGKVALNHTEITEKTVWEQGVLLSANEISLAWAKDNMPELIQTITHSLYQNPEQNSSQTPQKTEEKEIITNINPEDDNIVATKTNNSEQSLQQKIKSPKNLLVLFLAVLTLATLVFTFTPFEKQELKDTAFMQKVLEAQGFSQIDVITTEKGIVWQGIIDNDNEQAKLYHLAQSMHFPVRLELVVKDDVIRTFKQIMALEGIYPSINIDKENIVLGYYVKDALYQQMAEKALVEMFPKYGELQEKITEKIIFEPELRDKLLALQEKYPLIKLDPAFDKGKLLFKANYSKQEKDEIKTIFADLEKDLGFSIAYEFMDIVAPRSNTSLSPQQAQNTVEKKTNTMNFVVSSVNVDAIPFITLSNNEKIFIGGVLPNGGILEGIGLTELTINNNGTLTIYPLRGNNE